MKAIGKKKRGVWIGIYVLAEVFAFVAYLLVGAMKHMDAAEGQVPVVVWNVIFAVLFFIVLTAEIGYALIWRMAVMYRGIRRRTLWIVLNIIGWVLRMNLILILGGVITEEALRAWMGTFALPLLWASNFQPTGLFYFVLVWHDIVIWLNEPKEVGRKTGTH